MLCFKNISVLICAMCVYVLVCAQMTYRPTEEGSASERTSECSSSFGYIVLEINFQIDKSGMIGWCVADRHKQDTCNQKNDALGCHWN